MDGMWRLVHRKQAAEALRGSEEKFKRLIETTGTGYVILDDQGRVADANPEYVRMTGRQRLEEILGHSVLEWTAPHDLERNDREVRDCLARGLVRGLEVDCVAPDGRLIPIEVNATVLRTAEQGPDFDALPRHHRPQAGGEGPAKSARRTGAARYRANGRTFKEPGEAFHPFPRSPAGIFLSRSEDGLLLEVNDAYQHILGYSPEEMIGRTTRELGIFVNPDDRKRSIEILKRDGLNENLEMQYRHKSGRIVHLLINALPVNVDGVPCILGTTLDITKRKQAEAKLKEANRSLESSSSRLRALALEVTRVEHQERRRLAELLHDHLQQFLVAAKVNVAVMEQGELDEEQRNFARKATAAMDEAIAQSRSLAIERQSPDPERGRLGPCPAVFGAEDAENA